MSSEAPGLRIVTAPPVSHPGLRVLLSYWLELGGRANGLPSVQSFDPLHLTWLLPNIWILEIEPSTHRFRMRLAGENINAVYGRNIGGRYFSDVFKVADLDVIVERYTRSLTEPAIFYASGNVYAAAGRLCFGERLGLPMLGRTGHTDTLLGVTYYDGRIDRNLSVSITGDSAQFHSISAANHKAVVIEGV